MKTMRYPGLELHLERHKQLAHQVQEMMQDFLQGKTIVNLDALQFLHGWFSQHTLQEDPEIHLWRQKHDQQP